MRTERKLTDGTSKFSRRFVRENITKNQALDVKRNLKLPEKENINNCAEKGVSIRVLLFFIHYY